MEKSTVVFLLILSLISSTGKAFAVEKQSTATVQKKWITETQRIQLRIFLADVNRRVKRAWFPPRDGNAVTVRFKINSEGALEYARTSGNSQCSSCDTAALKAVTNAEPFRALPPGLPAIDIVYHFDYNVFTPDQPQFKILTLGDKKSGQFLIPSGCEAGGRPLTNE